jgi:hypothetical protein
VSYIKDQYLRHFSKNIILVCISVTELISFNITGRLESHEIAFLLIENIIIKNTKYEKRYVVVCVRHVTTVVEHWVHILLHASNLHRKKQC